MNRSVNLPIHNTTLVFAALAFVALISEALVCSSHQGSLGGSAGVYTLDVVRGCLYLAGSNSAPLLFASFVLVAVSLQVGWCWCGDDERGSEEGEDC